MSKFANRSPLGTSQRIAYGISSARSSRAGASAAAAAGSGFVRDLTLHMRWKVTPIAAPLKISRTLDAQGAAGLPYASRAAIDWITFQAIEGLPSTSVRKSQGVRA